MKCPECMKHPNVVAALILGLAMVVSSMLISSSLNEQARSMGYASSAIGHASEEIGRSIRILSPRP